MSGITNFNRFCSETEDVLSAGAAVFSPIAAIKFSLGTVQAITALALGIFSAPFRFCNDDTATFNDHCWTHVAHGLGNMARLFS